jgi:hypothetical protein
MTSGDASEQGSSGRDADECFGDVGELLEIADQLPVLDQPSEAALHHPAARQWLEAWQGTWPLDDV